MPPCLDGHVLDKTIAHAACAPPAPPAPSRLRSPLVVYEVSSYLAGHAPHTKYIHITRPDVAVRNDHVSGMDAAIIFYNGILCSSYNRGGMKRRDKEKMKPPSRDPSSVGIPGFLPLLGSPQGCFPISLYRRLIPPRLSDEHSNNACAGLRSGRHS